MDTMRIERLVDHLGRLIGPKHDVWIFISPEERIKQARGENITMAATKKTVKKAKTAAKNVKQGTKTTARKSVMKAKRK